MQREEEERERERETLTAVRKEGGDSGALYIAVSGDFARSIHYTLDYARGGAMRKARHFAEASPKVKRRRVGECLKNVFNICNVRSVKSL